MVVDDLSNSSAVAVDRVRELADGELTFHQLDLRDGDGLDAVFVAAPIDSVIHFCGLKAVGESVADPLRYFQVNLGSLRWRCSTPWTRTRCATSCSRRPAPSTATPTRSR